jgi:PAS domain S-box-containing protein
MIKIDCRDLAAHVRTQEGGALAALLDESADFFFIKNFESQFLYCNRAFLAAMGRRRDEVLGKSDFDLSPAHFAEGYFSDETRLFDTRLPVIRIEETLTPAGERFFVSTFKVAICDLHGELLGLAGFSRKIPNPADVEGVAAIKRQIADVLQRTAGTGATPSQLRALEMSLFAVIDDRDKVLRPLDTPGQFRLGFEQ